MRLFWTESVLLPLKLESIFKNWFAHKLSGMGLLHTVRFLSLFFFNIESHGRVGLLPYFISLISNSSSKNEYLLHMPVVWSLDKQQEYHLGACLKCRFSDLPQTYQIKICILTRFPGLFMCTNTVLMFGILKIDQDYWLLLILFITIICKYHSYNKDWYSRLM